MKRIQTSAFILPFLALTISALAACGDDAADAEPAVENDNSESEAELEEAQERLDAALAELDAANEKIAKLEESEEELLAAQDALEEAQAELEAAQQAVDDATSEEELEAAQADLEAAQAELTSANATLEDAESERDAAEQALVAAQTALDAAQAELEAAQQSVAQRWIVGGWISTVDEYNGYLTVVDDISSSGSIDLAEVVEFGGDMVYASPGGGVVFVGLESAPIIERWGVSDDDELEKQAEVSLANYGVTSTLGGGRNVMQFIDEDRAYYFDRENLQVVVFNPTDMVTVDSFSIAGLEEEGQELALNFIHRDGDRFIVTARYWDLQLGTTTSLVRAAIVDSADDTVQYTDDTRCGDIAFDVTDLDGNLYLGSHPGHAVYMAAGLDGDNPPPQCILRINRGESQFDPDYFVDLTELAGGVVGGLLHAGNGNAFVFRYAGEAITEENWQPSLRGDGWSLYKLKLGNEAATFAPVPGMDSFTAYGDSFTTEVDGKQVPFVVAVEADFSAGQYYDVSRPNQVVEALAFPGFPGPAIRID